METWDRSRTRWASWGRDLRRIFIPAAVAFATAFAWFQICNRHKMHLPHAAESILGNAMLIIAAIFAIAAALILNGAWERSQAIAKSLLTDNKQGFMVLRDEKIPNLMLVALTSFAVLVIVLLGATEFPTAASGEIVMAATSFALTLYFVVLHSLQNPMTNVWFARRTPKDWIDEDADSYFKPMSFDRLFSQRE